MGIPNRVGLVELFVGVEQGRYRTLSAALMVSIRRNADARRRDVLRILKDAGTAKLDLIMFPGWTLVGDDLPDEVIEAATNRTVVIELLRPTSRSDKERGGKSGKGASAKAMNRFDHSSEDVPWRTYVIHGGVKLGPFSQRIITGADAGKGNTPSQRTHMLKNELTSKKRSWLPESSLWICGEVNAIYGGGRGKYLVPWVNGLPTNWSIVANPAHTPSRLQAMRDKRAYLSKSGVLFTTANIHSAWMNSKGQMKSAGRTAAEVYRAGQPVDMSGKQSNAPATFEVGDHRVVVVG